MPKKLSDLPPPVLMVLSFLAVISLGGFLFKLPLALETGATLSWLNAFFVSTSAVCVTGLSPIDPGTTFSLFGELVMAGLMQVGGLGVMVLSSFVFLSLGRDVSIRQRLLVQDTFVSDYGIDMKRLVRVVVLYAVVIETVCGLGLTLAFQEEHGWRHGAYLGFWHSVSAFNNGGLSLFSDNLCGYVHHPFANALIMFLIVTGGIGFVVMWEVVEFVKVRDTHKFRLSLHTKVVLVVSGILIAGGALVIGVLERNNPAFGEGFFSRLWPSLFQAVTPRTAGFNTVDMGTLGSATVLFLMFLMFVGASPGSTGGGVKTTTFTVVLLLFWNRIRGNDRVNLFRRSVPEEQVVRSIALVLGTAVLLFIFTFVMVAFADLPVPGRFGSALSYAFEAVSAIGTVGLSLNFTPLLGGFAKLLIMLLMIFGRVGFLVLIYQVVESRKKAPIEYAEESVMIG